MRGQDSSFAASPCGIVRRRQVGVHVVGLCALLTAGGCSSSSVNACANYSGRTCIDLHVLRSAGVSTLLDQISVTALAGFVLDGRSPTVPQSSFDLPVALAVLPSADQGDFTLFVRGLRRGAEVGTAQARGVLQYRGAASVRVFLSPAGARPWDGGGAGGKPGDDCGGPGDCLNGLVCDSCSHTCAFMDSGCS